MRAVFELSGVYARLDETQRDDVNDVLIEWVLSEDETLRYDALFLVNETRYTRPYQPFVRFKIALKRLPQTWGTL